MKVKKKCRFILQPSLIIFTRGVNNFDHNCVQILFSEPCDKVEELPFSWQRKFFISHVLFRRRTLNISCTNDILSSLVFPFTPWLDLHLRNRKRD